MNLYALLFSVLFLVSLVVLIQAGCRYVSESADPRPIEMAKARIIASSFFLVASVIGWVVSFFFL